MDTEFAARANMPYLIRLEDAWIAPIIRVIRKADETTIAEQLRHCDQGPAQQNDTYH